MLIAALWARARHGRSGLALGHLVATRKQHHPVNENGPPRFCHNDICPVRSNSTHDEQH
jgi:hypothetical protein